MTNEEKLKLAISNGGIYEYAGMYVVFKTKKQFLAYTSAIEEKHQAQIAMLRARDKYYGAPCEYFDDHTKTWIPARFIALAFSKVDREPLVQAGGRMPIFGTWNSIRGLDEKGIKAAYALFEQSLSATQATSDAFIAEVKAGALEESAKKCRMISAANPYRYGYGADRCEKAINEMAAKFRTQAQAEGKDNGGPGWAGLDADMIG